MAKEIHIVIGPTSSGKSEYAVRLAKKVNGEIISADSRQVYKGFALSSGQVPGKWQKVKSQKSKVKTSNQNFTTQKASKVFVYKNIPHHCIDFVSPKRVYTVADFVKDGQKALADILSRGKTPIICGGTGHYIDALLFGQQIPDVPPDKKFREKMAKLSTEKLFARLQKLDPVRASNIDRHNPRRLIRALEIIQHTGKPVPLLKSKKLQPPNSKFQILDSSSGYSTKVILFGLSISYKVSGIRYKLKANSYQLQPEFHYLNPPREELYQKIEKRLKQRVKQGMLLEILSAHQKGVSWKRLEEMGLEFRHTSRFLKANSTRLKVNSLSDRNLKRPKQGKIKILNSLFHIPLPNSGQSSGSHSYVSLFLKSQHFQDLFTDIKKYTKRQNTWFKKYLS